jgi:hypothetical protein
MSNKYSKASETAVDGPGPATPAPNKGGMSEADKSWWLKITLNILYGIISSAIIFVNKAVFYTCGF